jgi:hypothetical protein
VEELQPWGKLLGDEESARWNLIKIPSKKPATVKTTKNDKTNQ